MASDRDHELREELVLAPSPRSTSPLHHTTAAGYDGNGNGHGLGTHDKDLYMANGDSHHRPFRSIGSGYGCIRHTFCLLNAVMWLCGCGLLGVGLWLRFAYGGYASLLSNYQGLSADGLCITAGAIAAIIAGCGCAGACFQNRCLLMTYFSSVAFAFLLELIVMVLCFIFKIELGETLVSELNTGVRQHYNSTNSLAITWDHIQREFDCCGVQSYTDWYSISAWPDESIVPDSCCLPWVTNSTDCGRSGQPSLWHRAGCYEVLHIWLLERLHLLGIAALVLAFVQLFGMVSSMMLYCTLGFKRKRFYTYRSYQPAS